MTAVPYARSSWLDRALRVFADVRAGEAATSLLLAVSIFLYMSSTSIGKVMRDALLVASATKLTGGQLKSYSSAGAAVLLLIVVPLYSRLASRVPRRRLMNIVTPVFVACLAGFYVLSGLGVRVGVPFYAFLAVLNVMIVALFWGFANDVYTDEEGKRLFPVVGVGMSAGAVAGALLAGRVAALHLNLSVLFLVAAALLVLGTLGANVVDARERRREKTTAPDALTSGLLPAATAQYRDATGEFRLVGDKYLTASGLQPVVKLDAPPPPEPTPTSTTGAFALVFRNPYLLLVATLVLLLNWVNTSGETILFDVVNTHAAAAGSTAAREAAVAQFYGGYTAATNIVTLLAQLFLVSRIIKYAGVSASLLVLPLIALGSYTTIAFVPLLGAIQVGKILENSTDYSLNNTVRQTLFLPTTREEKYKAKQVTDAFSQRMGDVLSAITVFIGTGLLGWAVYRLAYVNLVLIVVWFVIAVIVGRRYRQVAAATRL
jgi:AAA family ATP:ADP antiporter